MGRALFSIVSLIALAVLIVLNIDARTSFNLFGWQFEDIAVPVLAIVSFVLGALYSFIFYLLGYFSKSRSRKIARQREKLKDQEQTVKQQSQELRRERKGKAQSAESDTPRAVSSPPPTDEPKRQSPASGATPVKAERKRSDNPFRRFFGASSK